MPCTEVKAVSSTDGMPQVMPTTAGAVRQEWVSKLGVTYNSNGPAVGSTAAGRPS